MLNTLNDMQTDDRLKFKFLVLISCFILCSCTRIYNHSEKDPIPKKEPIKDRVYFTYGLKSKEAEESGGIYIVKREIHSIQYHYYMTLIIKVLQNGII